MNEKIKEVQSYFKQKFLNGDYQTIEITKHLMKISIDGYRFYLWISNLEIPNTIGIYQSEKSFMDLEFDKNEKLHLRNMLKPIINKHRRENLLKQKEAELDKLKKELEL